MNGQLLCAIFIVIVVRLGAQSPQQVVLGVPDPVGISMDTAGNIYASSPARSRVYRIDARSGAVSVVAGTGQPGYSGDGGIAAGAQFSGPLGVSLDKQGNLFIADTGNHRVRKVSLAAGTVTTVAGSGIPGFAGDGAAAVNAKLHFPVSVTVDPDGDLFIADGANFCIRKVSAANGVIATVAGTGSRGLSSVGLPAQKAMLGDLGGIFADNSGSLFISDISNNRIWKMPVRGGTLTSAAGSGADCDSAPASVGEGESASLSKICHPRAVFVDKAGDLLLIDHATGTGTGRGEIKQSARLLKVSATSNAVTRIEVFGTSDVLQGNLPRGFSGIASDSFGNIFYPLTESSLIVKLTPQYIAFQTAALTSRAPKRAEPDFQSPTVSTVSGGQAFGFDGDGGLASGARLFSPLHLAVDKTGNLFINDLNNYRIRMVNARSGVITTVAGNGRTSGENNGVATSMGLLAFGLACDVSGDLYISDSVSNSIRKVNVSTGVITTVAGNGKLDLRSNPSGRLATDMSLPGPTGIEVDSDGNMYFSSQISHQVWRVSAVDHRVNLVAGMGEAGYAGDGGVAINAKLKRPTRLLVDGQRNLFILDSGNCRVRRVDARTGVIDTVVGDGSCGELGPVRPGSVATATGLSVPRDIAVDVSGTLYIALSGAGLWRVDAQTRRFSPVTLPVEPGGASYEEVSAIAVGPDGSVYISQGNRVRKIDMAGTKHSEK